ncbi:MAG: hypothetical protein ACI845_000298 [Gammaproteobacteria bacterium]|jgi:hypothetical protein
MRLLPLLFCLLITPSIEAANIKLQTTITCQSDNASMLGRHQKYEAKKNSEKTKSRFSKWLFAENFSNQQSKVEFIWHPKTNKGPTIKLNTTDKAHNLHQLRSYTKDSLIVVTSASNPFSTESWTFALNFNLESLVATRVQSNLAIIKGEVITYNCQYESLKPLEPLSDTPAS